MGRIEEAEQENAGAMQYTVFNAPPEKNNKVKLVGVFQKLVIES